MKITQLREKDGNLTLSTTDLDTFLQKIKTETKTQPVSTFRQQLRYCLPGKRCNEADRLPKVLPAAEFRKTNGVCQMKTYNGIVELTVGPLSGKSEIALVKRLAWEQPALPDRTPCRELFPFGHPRRRDREAYLFPLLSAPKRDCHPADCKKRLPREQRLQYPKQPQQRAKTCHTDGRVHETPLRLPLQYPGGRSGIP